MVASPVTSNARIVTVIGMSLNLGAFCAEAMPAEVPIQFLGIAHGVPVVQPGHGAGAGHVGQYTVAPSGIR